MQFQPDIPFYLHMAAHPGQTHVFADREAPLASLYRTMVDAGNAVRRGNIGVHEKLLVHGYVGVGKSTLILQALGMLRGDLGPKVSVLGQRSTFPDRLPEPLDSHRWLILRVSGKHISSMEALSDTIQREVREAAAPISEPGRDPLLTILRGAAHEAARKAPATLELSFIDRLLSRRQAKDFEQVRAVLYVLAQTIEYVKTWYGAVQTDKLDKLSTSESARDAEATIEAQIKALKNVPNTGEANAALRVASKVLNKVGESTKVASQAERKWRVDTELVVEILNSFFDATEQAKLPTLLIIDDLDEVTSSIGTSHDNRAMVLSWILGPLTRLRPTCLVLGLRQEYTHEDTFRVYKKIHVLPMAKQAIIDAMLGWAEVQQPALSSEHCAFLVHLAHRITENFSAEEPAHVPLRFLTLVEWLNNNWLILSPRLSTRDMLDRYFELTFFPEASSGVKRLARAMTIGQVSQCARNSPIDPSTLAISEEERHALSQSGMLRPAMAGDAKDTRIVLDPLIAYLAKASENPPSET